MLVFLLFQGYSYGLGLMSVCHGRKYIICIYLYILQIPITSSSSTYFKVIEQVLSDDLTCIYKLTTIAKQDKISYIPLESTKFRIIY